MVEFEPMRNLPQGFAMALSQNPVALSVFNNLPDTIQRHYITRAHTVGNKAQMWEIIQELALFANRLQ